MKSRARGWGSLGLGSLLALGGCSLSGADLTPGGSFTNSCKTSDDCVGGRCRDGLCIGSNGSLTSLLVAVTPPPNIAAADLNSLTFFKTFPDPSDGNLGASGGGEQLNLDPTIDVSGSISIDTSLCSPPEWQGSELTPLDTLMGTIPADVLFTPSVRAFGVAADSYAATFVGSTLKNPYYGFSQTLPDGAYDVYVTPHFPMASVPDATDACKVPPHLVLQQTVTSTLDFKFAQASTQTVDVTWPLTAQYSDDLATADPYFANPLAGWTLDLVDPSSGRVLSTEEALTSPIPPIAGDMAVIYELTLAYAPVYTRVNGALSPSDVGDAILRLTPPAFDPRVTTAQVSLTAPTIMAQLDGTLVAASSSTSKSMPAAIVQATVLPAPVTVEFQTALGDGTPLPAGTPVGANVDLRATAIDGIDGLSTSFSRSVAVGADGVGTVELLPGHYRVSAAASACVQGSCLGDVTTDWVVAEQPSLQAGKLLEFVPSPHYTGTAFVAGGEPAIGANVTVVSSPFLLDSNVLNVGDGSVAAPAQASSSSVDASGSFGFDADAGTFALRIEPDPSTGYGWFVRPTLALPADGGDDMQVPEVDIDYPIGYFGFVNRLDASGNTTPVPSALIRAYVYVNPDGTFTNEPIDGTVAVQVAETYSGDEGHDSGAYTLLIPKTLDIEP